MIRYYWGADGVAKGNFAGINIWCICGIEIGVKLEVRDSKKTTKKQREKIVETIRDKCIWALGSTSPLEIDQLGIKEAEALSLDRAIKLLRENRFNPQHLHGDLDMPSTIIPNEFRTKDADDKWACVSAASIFAKYALDLYWERIHQYYPEYDFINNAGYGSNAKAAINQYGLIEGLHRKSYKPCKEHLKTVLINRD